MAEADLDMLFNNFPQSIFSNLKNAGSSELSPGQDSTWDSDEELWEDLPNWKHLFCSDSEVEEGEGNKKEENFCLFLSKIIAKLFQPGKGESWLALSPPSNSVEEVRIEELARMVNLLMEVASIVWKEAAVKLGGVKEDLLDLVSISILNVKMSF